MRSFESEHHTNQRPHAQDSAPSDTAFRNPARCATLDRSVADINTLPRLNRRHSI